MTFDIANTALIFSLLGLMGTEAALVRRSVAEAPRPRPPAVRSAGMEAFPEASMDWPEAEAAVAAAVMKGFKPTTRSFSVTPILEKQAEIS